MKKGSFCEKMSDFINFYRSLIFFFYIPDIFYQKNAYNILISRQNCPTNKI